MITGTLRGTIAALAAFELGMPALIKAQGAHSQGKPVTVTITNSLFRVGGLLSGSGSLVSPANAKLNSFQTATANFTAQCGYAQRNRTIVSFTYTIKALSSRDSIAVIATGLTWIHTGLSGADCQVRGVANVNGSSGYTFILTTHDGGKPADAAHPDYLRLQVMHMVGSSTVLDYDNLRGRPDMFSIGHEAAAKLTSGNIIISNPAPVPSAGGG